MLENLKNKNDYKDNFYSGGSEFNYSIGPSNLNIKNINSGDEKKEIANDRSKSGAVTDIVKNHLKN